MAKDSWIKTNLGNIFTGQSSSLTLKSEALTKVKFEADAVIQSAGQKGYAASEGLEVTANLLDALDQAGYNYLLMPPAAKSFANRISESTNKPVEDEWTAGIVINIQGPSIQETAEKYKALLDIITS